MSILGDVVERALARLDAAGRHELVLSVVDKLLAQMSGDERKELMEHVVERFLEGLPADERQATVRELVPSLLAQLMQSGGMSVDELLWAAMGSLGALEAHAHDEGASGK